jgi:tripartite-type tricarboxylate transporter receptor subunit TctC
MKRLLFLLIFGVSVNIAGAQSDSYPARPVKIMVGASAGGTDVHIPYKGSSQAHLDLLGGSVEMMIDTTSSAMSQIKAGRLRPLAVASAS